MTKKGLMALLAVLFTTFAVSVSCSDEKNDEYDPSAVSVISWYDVQKGLDPKETVKKESLPFWLQQWIDNIDTLPNSYILKAKNKNVIVYVLSSISSSSLWDYRNEDGSEWFGAYDGFYDIKIIYYKW